MRMHQAPEVEVHFALSQDGWYPQPRRFRAVPVATVSSVPASVTLSSNPVRLSA
jgi:hypothetical protein